jgi:hypothetical protein
MPTVFFSRSLEIKMMDGWMDGWNWDPDRICVLYLNSSSPTVHSLIKFNKMTATILLRLRLRI